MNNIAACYYICGDRDIAREFFNLGMKANGKSSEPDPVLIYNYCLLEGEKGGCEEDLGLTPLSALSESPERNSLMFALQLKKANYYSNSFYFNRRFNVDFFRNQTIAAVLSKSVSYLSEQREKFEFSKNLLFNQAIDNYGTILQKMVTANFIVCLISDKSSLFLMLWKTKNYCHFRCKQIRFLNREPIMTSNIIAHRKDDAIYIIFGIENKAVVYKYLEELIEINKITVQDLFSNIVQIESDRTSHQAHLILENREMYKFDIDSLKFEFVASTERTVDQIQINSRFVCIIFDNRSLIVRNIETSKKVENVNATKVKAIQLIDLMNLLVILNYKNEMLVVDLISNKVPKKKQMPTYVTSIICSKFHPLVIIYGHVGFINVVQVIDGEFITALGPFKCIQSCFYDEKAECLAVLGDQNNVKLFRLSLKTIGRQKVPHSVFRPVIIHTFDNRELQSLESSEQVSSMKSELIQIIKAFSTTKEVKHLITLEKNFEELKGRINLYEHYDFLLLMRKVNSMKYKNGVKEIEFNMVYEEFSFCHKIENKFNNIITKTSVSKNRRFMAISAREGPLYIYSLATLTLLQKIADVVFSHLECGLRSG